MGYEKGFSELSPHNDNDNAEEAKKKCLEICEGYSWCYAAQVTLRRSWSTPRCRLITDRPTFENVYGQGQNYAWGVKKTIDGVDYQTYCGGNGCTGTEKGLSWNGGKLGPRKEYFCYKKTN